jgi:hypothetical protein
MTRGIAAALRLKERTGEAYSSRMKVDVTYRIVIRPRQRVLRVRFRREDGKSIVLLFPDPSQFEGAARKAGLSGMALQGLEDDIAVVAQMKEQTHTRCGLEISPEELQRLGATDWREPQEFNLSFERTPEDKLRLTAREVDPHPGMMSLNVHTVLPKEDFERMMSRIGMHPRDVRDANMYGSQSIRRINEDEVETLIDSIFHRARM